MGTLTLKLLGGFEARTDRAETLTTPTRKGRALLAVLATSPDMRRSRERLAALLWERSAEEQARASLRQTLSEVRRALGLGLDGLLDADADCVWLDRERVSTDVAEFERLAGSSDTDDVEGAMSIWTGEFLDGFSIRSAETFEDWLTAERGRLHSLWLKATDAQLEGAIVQGRTERGIETARRVLESEPLREPTHRALMRLLAADGNRAGALEQYEQCRALLEQELNTSPDVETETLAQRIRADAPRRAPSEDVARELAPHPPGKPSLVIKPFENISADPEQDYFSEGLTQDITIALVKIPGLILFMDESPSYHKSRQMTVGELGRQFGARYVLKGGVRKIGGRVRVNVELVESSTGQHVWAERFDRELRDLFVIQDEITEEIVTAMDVKLLSGEGARFLRKALRNPAALDASYHGWDLLFNGTTKRDTQEAQHMFEEVIRLEPTSALGYASAAVAYWSEVASGVSDSPSRARERATELAREALGLGDTTGYSHLILALVHLSNREYDQAMAEATNGVADRPSCNGAYAIKASVFNYLGHPTEAIDFAQYAVRLTPVHPPTFPAILASAYHDSDRHEEAVAAARAAVELSDDKVDPYLIIAASSDALGRAEEARWATHEVLRVKPDFNLAKFAKAQPYKERKDLDRLIARLRNAGLN
jgi:TolB-like protein